MMGHSKYYHHALFIRLAFLISFVCAVAAAPPRNNLRRFLSLREQNTDIIKDIHLSKDTVYIGEPFLVTVELNDYFYCNSTANNTATRVTINGVDGVEQYLQLTDRPGRQTIFVIATTADGRSERSTKEVFLLDDCSKPRPLPWIQATESRYKPRSVAFRVGNGDDAKLKETTYDWNFGDGTIGKSVSNGVVEHDFTTALLRDELTTTFHINLTAHYPNGSNATVQRTVSVFNLYAYNKQGGTLTPRAAVQPRGWWNLLYPGSESVWTITINNLEDEPVHFNTQQIELLDSTPDSLGPVGSPTTISVTVDPRSSTNALVLLSAATFTKHIYGFAVHFSGIGTESRKHAYTSMYVKVKNPLNLGASITRPDIRFQLNNLVKAANIVRPQLSLSHLDMQAILAGQQIPPPRPTETATADSTGATRTPVSGGNIMDMPTVFDFNIQPPDPTTVPDLLTGGVSNFTLHTNQTALRKRDDPIVIEHECDPDNVPDVLPEGTTCQFTGIYDWRFHPGQILNAKKGDILLSSAGGGIIGQLLQHLSPAQYYSHSGIMTKNHIEVRHSTASDEWLLDHPDGYKGSNGFNADALRYLWPGTITQSIDHATYGEPMTSPEGKVYMISSFSFHSNNADTNTIAGPLVVKPQPQLETADVRQNLHRIADAASGIRGHYRFYGYTRPQLALEPAGVAPASAGWAAGTVPTVCSSLIWLACQKAGVRLEGGNSIESSSDFEYIDITRGAKAAPDTLDGLYLYSSETRVSAANWLYDYIYNKALSKAGFWGRLLTDAPDNVANQVVNTFASDFVDNGSKDSDAWKDTGDANAVSPDNTMFWDSPGPGNKNGFGSVYGYAEDLFYSPGGYDKVPVYKWKFVPTKGDLTGVIVAADGSVNGATVSLLGSGQPDVVVGADGKFSFNNVAAGDYTVQAGVNIKNYWESASQTVHITAGTKTNVILALQPPPEIHREITISIHMEITNKQLAACGTCTTIFDLTKTVWVHPFHSHDSMDFEARFDPGKDVRGYINFSVDLGADLAVTVKWGAQEIDDEVEGTENGAMVVQKDQAAGWQGLVVSNDDPIDADWTKMSWTVWNKQAGA